MRRLLYVPIIHSEADMGSAGAALARQGAAATGDQRWRFHQETVGQFWESMRAFLLSSGPCRLKVYQDGLAADGETGRRIVEEAAQRGSHNYRLVLELLDRGAGLRKTEDPGLLLREHRNILGLLQPEPPGEEERRPWHYQRERERLMEGRDKFIAETIGATLKEGEVGVLFIGAYHDLVSRLPRDISVEVIKDPHQVRAYFQELFLGHDDKRLEQLAGYLVSPVSRI